MNQETQIKLDECPLKGGIVNKARELCAKYGAPVVLEFNAFVWPDGSKTESWRAHICEQGKDLSVIEARFADLLDPENKARMAIAKAVSLEMEAAALRASVGGAA